MGMRFRFQPSLPARGATTVSPRSLAGSTISTLAPREGSDPLDHRGDPVPQGISTLAPREGSDSAAAPNLAAAGEFQPSLPARGATGRKGSRR